MHADHEADSPASSSLTTTLGRGLRLLLTIAFMAGALFGGYLFYDTFHEWFETPYQPRAVPEIPTTSPGSTNTRSNANPQPDAPNSTTQSAPTSEPPAAAGAVSAQDPPPVRWDYKDRVNFLLMGLDLRPGERGAAQTDTLIVVSLDPASKSVTMLSIPRDLWVPIPGYGENRINTAYAIGTLRNYPGGGPALTKKTVQYNLGIPIHYYVVINFVGFRKLVDALGGITIDVPKDLYDASFPDDRYGYRPLYIRKGVQTMNGDLALAYARTRHLDTDFGRMHRQQQVLKAIKDKALSLDILIKIPALWAAKEDMAQTDLTLNEIISLVQIAKDIKAENIRSAVIDDSMTTDWTTPSGAMVLLPRRDKIRALVAQLTKTPSLGPAEPADQLTRVASEGAKIEISNGTNSEGLAGRVSEWLKSQGFNVVLVDSADRADYAQTVFFEASERPYTRTALQNILHVNADKVRKSGSLKTNIDIHIILGRDFDAGMLPNSQ